MVENSKGREMSGVLSLMVSRKVMIATEAESSSFCEERQASSSAKAEMVPSFLLIFFRVTHQIMIQLRSRNLLLSEAGEFN